MQQTVRLVARIGGEAQHVSRYGHFARRAFASRQWGVAMDIDGVVVRGPTLIPGSSVAVEMLREAGVPYIFMTNGGGVPEAAKARELESLLGDDSLASPRGEARVLLSHTPMRELAERYRGRRVVLVGSSETVAVAESYGFDVAGGMAVTPAQIVAGTAGIYTREYRREARLPPVDVNADSIPIEAILIFYDPVDWSAELQVLTDVLAGGAPLGSGAAGGVGNEVGVLPQAATVYVSNPDFLWQAAYPVPRYGQAAFVDCLRALWRRRSGGGELHVVEYGKPHQVQYDAATCLLAAAASDGGGASATLRRLYMIGDNPSADIRGANGAGDLWRSILVCTGVYRGGPDGNDGTDPAWRVEKNLLAAVERLLSLDDHGHCA